MKVLTIGLALLLVTFHSAPSTARADEITPFEDRLKALTDNGVIDKDEAKKQILEIRSNSQTQFHNQVRGVASKINEFKVYEIINEPLEISSD